MPVPDHFQRFWHRLDELVGRVDPTWWGAVVTAPRFPAISDANYARIDAPTSGISVGDVETALLPSLRASGVRVMHVVMFHPEAHADLLDELVRRGHRRTWDAVMDLVVPPEGDDNLPLDAGGIRVEEPDTDEAFWSCVGASFALFGVEPRETAVELMAMERDLVRAGAKRWFAVRDGTGVPVSIAALIVLDGVGYVDNVCTFPQARGRGYATATTARAVREARGEGAGHVGLLVDPDATAVIGMYERLGFVVAGQIAATRGAVPDQSGGGM